MNFRSLRYSVFEAPPHKWLLIVIGWGLVLIVVLIQFDAVRDAFGIKMPTLGDVGFVLALGAAIFHSIEFVKCHLKLGRIAPVVAKAPGPDSFLLPREILVSPVRAEQSRHVGLAVLVHAQL